jgi:hypothetical protein
VEAGHRACTLCLRDWEVEHATNWFRFDGALNDSLGAWLDKKKKAAGTKEIDLKWLKDYRPQSVE